MIMREVASYLLEDALACRENRSAFFQKGLDYLGKNSIRGMLHDREYLFHWNINLYIETLKKCNGHCPFCINQVNYEHEDIQDSTFISNLDKAIQLVQFLDPSILLVGGEPTIAPERVRGIFELIKKYKLRKPVITTNGSGFVLDKNLLDDISPYLAHLNFSRHHDDDTCLNKIMGFKNPLTNSILGDFMKDKELAPKIRLNCCLLEYGIQSYTDIERYLAWVLSLGIKNVCFSTLSLLPDDYFYDPRLVLQTNKNAIDFNAIMGKVTDDPRFSFIKFHTGSHCMYEVWQYTRDNETCSVVFVTSDNYFARELDRIDNLIELLVFHADGFLTGSWNRNCKVIG